MHKIFLIIALALISLTSRSTWAITKILFLGDSIAQGYGLEKEQAFPHLLQKKLKEKSIDVEILNGSISGSTTASGVSRLKWYMKSKPDAVVLELGANDGLRGMPVEQIEQRLVQIIEYAQTKNIPVLLTGMQMPPNYGKKYTEPFKELYPKLAKKYNLLFMPFLLKDVVGEKKLNQDDGIHPNEKGQEVIATNMLPYLEKLIKSKEQKK